MKARGFGSAERLNWLRMMKNIAYTVSDDGSLSTYLNTLAKRRDNKAKRIGPHLNALADALYAQARRCDWVIPHLSRYEWGIVTGMGNHTISCLTMDLYKVSPGRLAAAINNYMGFIEQMQKSKNGEEGFQFSPKHIVTTEHDSTFNTWFSAKRSLAEFFTPKSGGAYGVGLHYLKSGVKRLNWTMMKRRVVTREPMVSLMFLTNSTSEDPVGVSVLLHQVDDIEARFYNTWDCPTLPHAKDLDHFLGACRQGQVSKEQINLSTVNASFLLQILAKEF